MKQIVLNVTGSYSITSYQQQLDHLSTGQWFLFISILLSERRGDQRQGPAVKWPKFPCKQPISSVQMQFKLLVVKVLLNFMVSFQGKLHAMYYLIDCFLLLNILLFPPPVFSLISRDDNDFSGRKGEWLAEIREIYLKNEHVGGKELPKQTASLGHVRVIFSQ